MKRKQVTSSWKLKKKVKGGLISIRLESLPASLTQALRPLLRDRRSISVADHFFILFDGRGSSIDENHSHALLAEDFP